MLGAIILKLQIQRQSKIKVACWRRPEKNTVNNPLQPAIKTELLERDQFRTFYVAPLTLLMANQSNDHESRSHYVDS